MAKSLEFIHNNNICHFDIKPQNIIVRKNKVGGIDKYSVKLIDFGESLILLEDCENKFYTYENSKDENSKDDIGINITNQISSDDYQ